MGASDFANLPHIGEAVRRKEDYRFLTGAGNYTDDIHLANEQVAVFVRSPHAHARVKSIDISAARAAPATFRTITRFWPTRSRRTNTLRPSGSTTRTTRKTTAWPWCSGSPMGNNRLGSATAPRADRPRFGRSSCCRMNRPALRR